jgi:twitching motility protein PilT
MSLASFLSILRASGAEKIVLAAERAPRLVSGSDERPLSGSPTSAAELEDALGELISADELAGLPSTRARVLRHEQDGQSFVLELSRRAASPDGPSGVCVVIRFASPRAAAPPPPRARASARPPAHKKAPSMALAAPAGARARPEARPASQRLDAVHAAPAPELTLEHALIGSGSEPRRHAQRHTPPEGARTPERRGGGHEALAAARPAPRVRSGPALIDELLREMVARKASDLHLSTGAHPVLRVHGEMAFLRERPLLTSEHVEALVLSIATEKAERDFAELRDADFAYEVPGLSRFRVNVFADRNGTGAVLRQIPMEILSAEQLGLPRAATELCWLSKGLVVVTGPTGSGKSTTLAAMIDFINQHRSDHIITVEDPVEFVHPNKRCLVNQREVGQHTKSFKHALRAALREDPDIVLVGEMRDLETISIAIETAETGHLVFGTLHTTTAVSTIDRIVDQFPADRQAQIRVMLSESLKGVIAQMLLPKVGGGRVAAHEILLGSSAVTALIRDGKTFQLPSVMQTSKNLGMVTMNDSLMTLVKGGLVEPKQAWVKAVDKAGLVAMLKAAGLPSSF